MTEPTRDDETAELQTELGRLRFFHELLFRQGWRFVDGNALWGIGGCVFVCCPMMREGVMFKGYELEDDLIGRRCHRD